MIFRFVSFASSDDCNRAVSELNEKEFNGSNLRVQSADGGSGGGGGSFSAGVSTGTFMNGSGNGHGNQGNG